MDKLKGTETEKLKRKSEKLRHNYFLFLQTQKMSFLAFGLRDVRSDQSGANGTYYMEHSASLAAFGAQYMRFRRLFKVHFN